jgi:hypothetical protein
MKLQELIFKLRLTDFIAVKGSLYRRNKIDDNSLIYFLPLSPFHAKPGSPCSPFIPSKPGSPIIPGLPTGPR